MKKNLKILISLLISTSLVMGLLFVGVVYEKRVKAATYNLVWSDEFDGDSLDTNNWNYEVNGKGGGNQEHQYYTDRKENVEVSDGTLKIHALQENYKGKLYTSGRINTLEKQSFKYGKIEARMKLPRFQGAWPAFWMMGSNYKSTGWPRCGEIDIMEAINNNDEIHANLHWSNGNSQADTSGMAYEADDRTQWHTYGFEWTENHMKFYVDDKIFQSYRIDMSKDMEEFRRPQFIILNLAIGGRWPGHTIDDSAFPDKSTMEVDYVRAYERTDNPTTYVGPTKTVHQDAVAEYSDNWVSTVNKEKLKTEEKFELLGEAKDGFVADYSSIGKVSKESVWNAKVSLKGLDLYPNSTYKLGCTITCDKDKRIYVRVIDEDGLELHSQFIDVKANEPYVYSSDVDVIDDINGKPDLEFGFAKVNGEAIDDNASINVKVENISLVTDTSIPDPTTAVETITTINPDPSDVETSDVTNQSSENKVAKPAKVKIKKIYKKKKSAKSIKLVLKKAKNATKYEVAVYKTKKKASKNKGALVKKTFKKVKVKIISKKLKNKKKLFVRARGINTVNEYKKYGAWSSIKQVKAKSTRIR